MDWLAKRPTPRTIRRLTKILRMHTVPRANSSLSREMAPLFCGGAFEFHKRHQCAHSEPPGSFRNFAHPSTVQFLSTYYSKAGLSHIPVRSALLEPLWNEPRPERFLHSLSFRARGLKLISTTPFPRCHVSRSAEGSRLGEPVRAFSNLSYRDA